MVTSYEGKVNVSSIVIKESIKYCYGIVKVCFLKIVFERGKK